MVGYLASSPPSSPAWLTGSSWATRHSPRSPLARSSKDLDIIIGHNKGTAYTYPTWVQLVFGQSLVFDRSDEKEGQPVLGKQPTAVSQNSTAR